MDIAIGLSSNQLGSLRILELVIGLGSENEGETEIGGNSGVQEIAVRVSVLEVKWRDCFFFPFCIGFLTSWKG